MIMVSEYNRRQYFLILRFLDDFQSGRATVREVAVGLGGLLSALEDVPKDWKQDFLRAWGVFEDISASMIVSGEREIEEQSSALLRTSCGELCGLVAKALEKDESEA